MAKEKEYKPSLEYRALSRLVPPDADPVEATRKDKLLWAGFGSISGAIASALVPIVFKKRIDPRTIMGAAAAGIMAGYSAPNLANTILKEKRGDVEAGTAERLFKAYDKDQNKVRNKIETAFKFKKHSSLASAATPVVKFTGKALKGAGSSAWHGITQNPFNPKAGFGEKMWGIAMKGAVGTGAYIGANKLVKRRQLSGPNYTTMLRNNVLAGNITPTEMSQPDLVAVRRLGMR